MGMLVALVPGLAACLWSHHVARARPYANGPTAWP